MQPATVNKGYENAFQRIEWGSFGSTLVPERGEFHDVKMSFMRPIFQQVYTDLQPVHFRRRL